ncbi:hypothetical protein [Streptomyces sp. NPDC059003]|uniref:terpene synthase family protein n=1 Tax=Streptomyces sp. NPDC059003 TaxID=3346691 RepID=UPI003681DECE
MTPEFPYRLWCPVPPRIHPRNTELINEARSWLDRFPLVEEEKRDWLARFSAEFITFTIPDGLDEREAFLCRYSAWGFSLDDRADRNLTLAQREFVDFALRLVHTSQAPDSRLLCDDQHALCLADLIRDMRTWAAPPQMRRFHEGLRSWMFGTAWEVGARQLPLPDVDAYLSLHYPAVAAQMEACVEVGLGPEVPASEIYHPLARAVQEAAFTTALIDNDLLSSLRHGDDVGHSLNIVNVLRNEQPSTPQEQAITQSVGLRDRIFKLALDLNQTAQRKFSQDTRNFLDGIIAAVPGNIAWSLNSVRYKIKDICPDLTHEQFLKAATQTGGPSDATTGPPPYRSIAWWWDQS